MKKKNDVKPRLAYRKVTARKQKQLKPILTKPNGYIAFILIGIIALAFAIAGGASKFVTPPSNIIGIPVGFTANSAATEDNKKLQLRTFGVQYVTPTLQVIPSPTSIPLPSVGLAECYSANADIVGGHEQKVFAYADATPAGPGQKIRVWYKDEHAVSLGKRGGYAVSEPPQSGGASASPVVVGDSTAKDTHGRPVFPAIYLTDLTSCPSQTCGDWETAKSLAPAIIPHFISGSWKFIEDNDPFSGNIHNGNWDLPGGDQPPPGTPSDIYGAEVRWDVDTLVSQGKMIRGHAYRVEVIVHDGDQSQDGGDWAEGCTSVQT